MPTDVDKNLNGLVWVLVWVYCKLNCSAFNIECCCECNLSAHEKSFEVRFVTVNLLSNRQYYLHASGCLKENMMIELVCM